MSAVIFFKLATKTIGGMASKGKRAIPCQDTRKVEAGYNSSHTSETLIGYTVCYKLCILVI